MAGKSGDWFREFVLGIFESLPQRLQDWIRQWIANQPTRAADKAQRKADRQQAKSDKRADKAAQEAADAAEAEQEKKSKVDLTDRHEQLFVKAHKDLHFYVSRLLAQLFHRDQRTKRIVEASADPAGADDLIALLDKVWDGHRRIIATIMQSAETSKPEFRKHEDNFVERRVAGHARTHADLNPDYPEEEEFARAYATTHLLADRLLSQFFPRDPGTWNLIHGDMDQESLDAVLKVLETAWDGRARIIAWNLQISELPTDRQRPVDRLLDHA